MGCAPSSQSLNHEGKDSPIKAKNMNGDHDGPDTKGKGKKDKKASKKKSGSFVNEDGGSSNRKGKEASVKDKDLLREMENDFLKGDRVKKNAKNKTKKFANSKMGVIDKEAEQFFEVAEVGQGDEFMAVLPWKGAIKEPRNHPKPNPAKPDEDFEIDFVHGYRSEDCRQNCFYNSNKKPVYMTAALGIILDPKTRKQLIFGGGETQSMERKQTDNSLGAHTDDIMSLAISHDRTLIATGQVGLQPTIFVWDANTAESKYMMKLPKGSRSANCLGFNKDATLLAVTDLHNDHNVYVFRIEDQSMIFSDKSGPDKAFMLHWSLIEDTFMTVGPKHIYTWSPNQAQKKKKGIFGGAESTNLVCVTYDDKGVAYTGAQNGSIYKWQSGGIKSTHPIHKGVVHSIRCCVVPQDKSSLLLSGGSDNLIVISNPESMVTIKQIQTEAVPRSLDYGRYLLAGMKNGSIVEFDLQTGAREIIMNSHHDGEVWGLCMVPGLNRYFTSGDDNKILMFDLQSRKCVQKGQIIPEAQPEKKQAKVSNKPAVGGASSESSEPPENQSRALAFNSQFNHLAVGTNTGHVTIRQVNFNQGSDLNTVIFKIKDSKEWIECMAYSPQNDKLAVGSHDNNIYVYVVKNKYAKFAVLKGHNSFITCLDWSLSDSPQYIRSNCGAYELLFFNVDAKKQDSAGASNTVGTQWATSTCKLGWSVQGIYPPGCDGTHINGVDFSKNQSLIATGDDYGLVNIYRNPCLEEHQAKSYRGHSEHVTRVMFCAEDEYLISIGGMDQTVIQWKKK